METFMTETTAAAIRTQVKAFIVSNFLFGREGDGIGDDQSFLESGLIDSTGLLELIAFVESEYAIAVEDRELVPENLDSLSNISQFILRKQAQAGSGSA